MNHTLLSRRSEGIPRAAEPVDSRQIQVFHERYSGEAYWRIEPLEEHLRRCTLVVTDNPCEEYALDLLDLQVSAVFVGQPDPEAWLEASLYAQSGLRSGLGLNFHSTLTCSEREPLKFLPMGWSNARIAAHVGKSERTIRNRVSDVLEKMRFLNRTQLAMYYIGQWQWLDEDPESRLNERAARRNKS